MVKVLLSLVLSAIALVVLEASRVQAGIKEEYFLVRQDHRKCSFPKCGGFFLNPVNVDKFDCPGGEVSRRSECYVAEIKGVAVSPSLALVRGRFVPYDDDINSFDAVEGYEGKITPHPFGNEDDFGAVKDLGINCVSAPCNTYHVTKLNQRSFEKRLKLFAELDFSNFPNSEHEIRVEMRNQDVIVSASSYDVEGPSGSSEGLKISNFFIRIADPPKPCTKRTDCTKSEFCSKASCSATDGFCKIKPSSCPNQVKPVCACDGAREYDNDCIRQLFGVTAATSGKCAVEQQ